MFRSVARLSTARAREGAQVALDQGDARALDRDVGAGPHRDTHVGFGERRRIVDAIAGERDRRAAVAQLAHDLAFTGRQHFTVYVTLVDAQAARDGQRRQSAVATHHDDAEPVGLEQPDGFGWEALMGSATPSRPMSRPSRPTKTTVCPSRRSSSAERFIGAVSMPRSPR